MTSAEILNTQWSAYFERETALDGLTHLEENFDGRSVEALLRHRGAYILAAHAGSAALLGSPGFNPYNPDLSWPAADQDKFDATHFASPAGSMPGQAIRQHGDSRYTLYRPAETDSRSEVTLQAIDKAQGLDHSKHVSLLPDGLRIVDRLDNNTEPAAGGPAGRNAVLTSALEHFYIPVARDDIPGIVMLDDEGRPAGFKLQPDNGEALRGGFADIAEGLAGGRAYLHEQFFYSTRSFRFPDGRLITVGAHGRASDSPNAGTALAIWHRPGTDSICIEPVAGVRINGNPDQAQNNTIYIPPKGYLQLTSSIRVEGVSA